MRAPLEINALPTAGTGAMVATTAAAGTFATFWTILWISIILTFIYMGFLFRDRITSRWLRNGRE